MIYASGAISLGFMILHAALDEDSKVLCTIGILIYFAGLFIGNAIENRLEKRIKELEDKLKEG